MRLPVHVLGRAALTMKSQSPGASLHAHSRQCSAAILSYDLGNTV